MPKTIELYRDELTVDKSLETRILNGWRGSPGADRSDTVVLGARRLIVNVKGDFLPGINIVLLADRLVFAPNAEILKYSTAKDESSVTVLARQIGEFEFMTPLNITVQGKAGDPGRNGRAGYEEISDVRNGSRRSGQARGRRRGHALRLAQSVNPIHGTPGGSGHHGAWSLSAA